MSDNREYRVKLFLSMKYFVVQPIKFTDTSVSC